jgi:sugar phosphate isomerase/epimerase
MACMGKPSIQCSTGPFWAFELEQAMDHLAAAGFTEIELMVTRDPSTQEPDLPLQLAEERGLKISSVHGPFLVITKSVWGLDPIAKIERGAEMCRALGAATLIVHPPFLWESNYARWLKEEAPAFEEETGVMVAVETMYPKWVAGRRMRAYRWLAPGELAQACHRVALDTSHLAVARADLLDAYETLAPKLVHVHLSDNDLDGRDGHLQLGRGRLPLDRLLDELRRDGYDGTVSLELSVRGYLERPKELVAMLERNRAYVEEHLSRPRRVAKGLPRP